MAYAPKENRPHSSRFIPPPTKSPFENSRHTAMSAAADKSTMGTTLSFTDIGVSLLVVLRFSFSFTFFSDSYVEPPGNGYNFTLIF